VNPINALLVDVATYAYGVGAVFGVLFLIQLARTDFYRHPWGRNVAAFMACLVPLRKAQLRNHFSEAMEHLLVIRGKTGESH
jgi:hypothetical protein